jgi:GT2 family glycosyltransferase
LRGLSSIDKILDVFIVDDGSTDGTKEAIVEEFPNVHILLGNGQLFWNRGMFKAWEEASKQNYDFYIWLNDDTELFPDFLEELLFCSSESSDQSIISGIIEDSNTGEIIYGGYDEKNTLILANGRMNSIHHMNGNVVLVPKQVFARLGNLDAKYHHDLGDVDYGLRAKQNGINVITTRKSIATGTYNPISRSRLNNSTISRRFSQLYSPLGSNPKINFYFRNRHKGFFNALCYFIFQHLLNIIPDKFNALLFKSKYQ